MRIQTLFLILLLTPHIVIELQISSDEIGEILSQNSTSASHLSLMKIEVQLTTNLEKVLLWFARFYGKFSIGIQFMDFEKSWQP